jgi:hypothetical protein
VVVLLRTQAFCPQVINRKSSRKNCYCCANSFYFWTNGTANKRGEGEGQHNVMETADFTGKPFPCPVCNMGLRLKISRKAKPYWNGISLPFLVLTRNTRVNHGLFHFCFSLSPFSTSRSNSDLTRSISASKASINLFVSQSRKIMPCFSWAISLPFQTLQPVI